MELDRSSVVLDDLTWAAKTKNNESNKNKKAKNMEN